MRENQDFLNRYTLKTLGLDRSSSKPGESAACSESQVFEIHVLQT